MSGMSDYATKTIVSDFLMTRGYAVTEVERDSDKTPDLKATYSAETFLIEVKEKGDDPERLKCERDVLERGQIASHSESLGRRNTLSAIARKAASQLRNRLKQNEFGVVWMCLEGQDLELLQERTLATFYGTQQILDIGGDDQTTYPCFYFENSEFFNHRYILSGAVIQTGSEAFLCVNDLHPQSERFRASRLVHTFSGAFYDPKALETAGQAYSVDSNVDRARSAEVLEYVRRKYGNRNLINLQFSQHSASAQVPNL